MGDVTEIGKRGYREEARSGVRGVGISFKSLALASNGYREPVSCVKCLSTHEAPSSDLRLRLRLGSAKSVNLAELEEHKRLWLRLTWVIRGGARTMCSCMVRYGLLSLFRSENNLWSQLTGHDRPRNRTVKSGVCLRHCNVPGPFGPFRGHVPWHYPARILG